MKKIAATVCAWGASALLSLASAHVVLEYQVAPAATSYKATFRVGHGCGNSPTREISVDIPAGVRGARPMPKPGWALKVERAPLAQPYASHGKEIKDEVVRITWTAKTADDMLPHAHYDEFVMMVTTPEQAGILYWPVRQACESGSNDWVEIPRPNQNPSELKSPAATLEVMPSAAAGHAH